MAFRDVLVCTLAVAGLAAATALTVHVVATAQMFQPIGWFIASRILLGVAW